MGILSRKHGGRARLLLVLSLAGLFWSGAGCVVTPPVSTKQILRQQALLDFTGLLPARAVETLNVRWAVPRDWEALPSKTGLMFTHQQYRSPSGVTGVGVAYVRLPFPIPSNTIAWIAQREYLKKHSDQKEARLIGRWSDAAGREWFEGENNKYHGTGYVMTRGNEAWIVYSGWRVTFPPNPEEISISRRSVQTIVPMPRG
jgi:hypothetical protein